MSGEDFDKELSEGYFEYRVSIVENFKYYFKVRVLLELNIS